MIKNKTIETDTSLDEYLEKIEDPKKREDTSALIHILRLKTGIEPKIWGAGIVGFGRYHYKYESGHEGIAPLVGISARANAISVYLVPNFAERDLYLSKLGKHKSGKGCIYIQKLEHIDTGILGEMVVKSIEQINKMYPQ
jgi:hypothetical protein